MKGTPITRKELEEEDVKDVLNRLREDIAKSVAKKIDAEILNDIVNTKS